MSKPGAAPNDRHEAINGDGDPDLAFHGVLRGAEEGLDSKELLDPHEEIPFRMAAFPGMMIHDLSESELSGVNGQTVLMGSNGMAVRLMQAAFKSETREVRNSSIENNSL